MNFVLGMEKIVINQIVQISLINQIVKHQHVLGILKNVMMANLAIIIQIKVFVIKFMDVLLMTDIVFHMKIVVFQQKTNVKEQHLLEYNVFGMKLVNHA